MEMSFDENDYLTFRKKYRQAVKNNQKEFIFKDQEFLVSYAKYVIEYLEMDPVIKSVMHEPDPDD